MKIVLVGGHSAGRVVTISPNMLRFEVPYSVGDTRAAEFDWMVPDVEYQVETYYLEMITEGRETFYYGRHSSLKTAQAAISELLSGYRPNAKDSSE